METNNKKEHFGYRLAELGGRIYSAADDYLEIEQSEDYQAMMRLVNKIAFECIHGHPQRMNRHHG